MDGTKQDDGGTGGLEDGSADEVLQEETGKTGAVAGSVVGQTSTSIFAKIMRMKEQQAELKRQRKEGQKELKNLQRKRKRLNDKAKLLSDEDLLQVLTLRREAKAMSKASSSAGGGAEATTPSPAKP